MYENLLHMLPPNKIGKIHLKELLCLRRKFSLKPPWAEVEFSDDAEGFVISIY